MKKYRRTKITVKTSEIILLSKDPANGLQDSICPVCHAPLSASLLVVGNSDVEANDTKQSEELPAKATDNQDM